MSVRTASQFRQNIMNAALQKIRPEEIVQRVVAKWTAAPPVYKGEGLVAGWWGGKLTLNFSGVLVCVPTSIGEPEYQQVKNLNGSGNMTAWGLEKLAPGVWDISPSICQPARFHAYITIVDVPEPAPWESDDSEDDRRK